MPLFPKFALGVLVASLWMSCPLQEARAADFSRCPQGKQHKIAILQLGTHAEFQQIMLHTLRSLKEAGLMLQRHELSAGFHYDERTSYRGLVNSTRNDCLSFAQDGLYNADWDIEEFEQQSQAVQERIASKGDIDMLLAFGTGAGIAVTSREALIPTLVIGALAPEHSGISRPGHFSDTRNVHVIKELNRYAHELSMFYNLFKFKTLGVMYDQNYTISLGQGRYFLQERAEQLGFDMEICTGDLYAKDLKTARSEFERCISELSEKADAVYITTCPGADHADFYRQIKPLIDRDIPTLSQRGRQEVAYGALMCAHDSNFEIYGEFEANVIAKVADGVSPQLIPQYYFSPQYISLNLKTARLINWRPPFDFLTAVDYCFRNININ